MTAGYPAVMDIQVYSLARAETISLAQVRTVLTSDTTIHDYYQQCVGLFPLVLAPMTDSELQGQRSLTEWECRKDNKNTDCYRVTERLNALSKNFRLDRTVIPADLTPEDGIDISPLFTAWKSWGRALYGSNKFEFGFNQTLRRDAVPMDPTVGHHIHSDISLEAGHRDRQLAIFSLCADSDLETAYLGQHDWWTTRYCDMGQLSYEDALGYERTRVTDDDFLLKQSAIEDRCNSFGLPANHHIVMPNWFLHRASNLFDAPESYDDLFPPNRPQPKAYVSHATLYGPER